MAKHIIVCSDGTGNTAVKGRGTNVFKVFEAVDLNAHRFDPELAPQIAIYDDGVGTQSFAPLKLLGGIGGFGLSRNVRQLYKELCRIYDPGDRIYLFGFSRGAFTVRTLGGFIGACGILKQQASSEELERKVRQAYEVYRRRYRTALMKLALGEPDRQEQQRFREQHCYGDEQIAFIGVWDTVDAVGLPLPIANFVNATVYQFKFPNYRLGAYVEQACHALAIDDERESFQPLLWDARVEPGARRPNIEQVWFAGAHSNVGGGYPKQGMSLVALDWLMQRAESAGLRFVAAERGYYRDHANVDDKLYNPRAGLMKAYRWLPRNIASLCDSNGVEPAVHLSVLERAAHGTLDYCPGNLPPQARVVATSTGDAAKDRVAAERAREVGQVLAASSADGSALLAHVGREIAVGRLARWWFILGLSSVLAAGGWLLASGEPLRAARHWLATAIVGFALSYLCGQYADTRMQRVFSSFWFGQQQRLRDAFKRARASAAANAPRAPAPEHNANCDPAA